jgi:putative membrane protein
MPHTGPDALEILRQRYASGEIDGTTFDQMRERLEASAGGPRNY